MWDQQFEQLVRDRLPGLDPGTPLTADLSLPAFGLDSMATVGLIVALEETYGLALPETVIAPATFATPGAIWTALRPLITAAGSGVGR
ncbi:acyl carrier protein [Streptomyces sp. NPDC058000]|uniref:acyl carrier protein n=1 Tax=Streptomyces sp. NPDC058000 TaxID=3346299 RepID=UPI0036EAC9A9